jgi:endonuclease YncB( thermonuclease family)
MGLFDFSTNGFGSGPSLLRGSTLDPGDVGPSSTGVVPNLTVGAVTDPSVVGGTSEEPDSSSDLTGGAGDLISQENNESGPTRSTEDRPRGTPMDQRNTRSQRAEYFERGRRRVNTLTDLFGLDALVLGHLVFDIPPTAIRIKKGNITYRWKPLRTKESIAVKSGNGECYIEIDLAFDGIDQIRDSLSELISLWKKVPFCYVENAHIRKMMIPEKHGDSMALCLETLVLDAVAGRPSTVFATLVTRWFNYKPFSQNFWFRRDWRPLEGNIPQPNRQPDNDPRRTGDRNVTREGQPASSSETDPSRTILQDLSAIQDPAVLADAGNLPPEVGLFESRQSENPGDPTIAGTYPVVYPFNSQPFLDRVRQGADRPERIRSWSDSLRMNWNSFVRMPVPSSWRYSVERPPEVSVAATRPRQRQNFRAQTTPTGRIPQPVTGERTKVLFIGDSLMVGMTGQARTNGTSPGDGGIPFFQWNGNSRFPTENGFTYYGMMRVGARSVTMRSWWNTKKTDSDLKAPGNSSPCSGLAGVVIHSGTNDGATGPNIGAIRTIMQEAAQFGAIPVLLPLPPSDDADHISPAMRGHLRILFGSSSEFEAYQQALPDHHSQMMELARSVNNGVLLDYHVQLVEDQFRGSRSAPLAEIYMVKNSPRTGYYNIHWNPSGYTAAGNWVKSNLPWSSLRGQPQQQNTENNMWTVCAIEDGDTVWVWGTHPDDPSRQVLRSVRLQYCDTPETYSVYSDSQYNAGGANPLPNGQDSYRPASAKYGNLAKQALSSKIRVNSEVRIEWGGTGHYGRFLGVLFQGEEDINLWLVKNGYAFASLPRRPSSEMNEQEVGFKYWRAEQEARGLLDPPTGPRGIWAQQAVELEGVPDGFSSTVRAHLERLMEPKDFRAVYAPSSDGGQGGAPNGCTQAPVEEAGVDDPGGVDADVAPDS